MQSISLGLMAILILIKVLVERRSFVFLGNSETLSWMILPIICLFSLSYSQDYHRGWNEWLCMIPLLVLPLFLSTFDFSESFRIFSKVFIVAILISVLAHFTSTLGFDSLKRQRMATISLFFSIENNGWIAWSFGIISFFISRNKYIKVSLIFIALCCLGYLGQTLLIISLMLFYFCNICFENGPSILKKAISILILIAIIVFIYFSSSLIQQDFSLLPTNADQFLIELKFSLNQWWEHPLNGVGYGNYIHAMWNEYNEHQMQSPLSYTMDFFHLLVSLGILAIVGFYMVIKSYFIKSKGLNINGIYFIACFFYLTPCISQVSTASFTIALIFANNFFKEIEL